VFKVFGRVADSSAIWGEMADGSTIWRKWLMNPSFGRFLQCSNYVRSLLCRSISLTNGKKISKQNVV
jgi:hypothetical protein